MPDKKSTKPTKSGPPSYENWVAYERGAPAQESWEYPFYTDARIVGELTEGYGPYQFFNTLSLAGVNDVQSAIVLRAHWHAVANGVSQYPNFSETDEGYYHGGDAHDELAALLSLALGIRCKAGPANRRFAGGDPCGNPIAWDCYRPVLPFRPSVRGPIIPQAAKASRSLDLLNPLKLLPRLRPTVAIAIIRAARLYQDGLWISESEPSLSWLMFVSAIEVAAENWSGTIETPLDALTRTKPELVERLTAVGGRKLCNLVAREFAHLSEATRKFCSFVQSQLGDPPTARPPPAFRCSWDSKNMRSTLGRIYKYRSRALHGGTPFPVPMCEPPFNMRDWDAPSEVPHGLATSAKGGVWRREDTGMLLHVFEQITREVLLKWWVSASGGEVVR